MRLYGLIGYPLSHSFSAKYFTQKFLRQNIINACYSLFPIQNITDLNQVLQDNPDLRGLNVTIPYKLAVKPFLSFISEDAEKVGAVNCIKISKENDRHILQGFNTDVYGFENSLKPLLNKQCKNALVLGTGGTSKAVLYVLDKLGITSILVSRNPENTSILGYHNLTEDIIASHKLIVNTSPLGMYPNIADCPDIPYHLLENEHVLYDLVYNPEETLFLKKGKAQGAFCKNGMEMLILQAEKSWEIWNSQGV